MAYERYEFDESLKNIFDVDTNCNSKRLDKIVYGYLLR